MKTLTIVVHCWHYEHMLAYQLSSLVKHPPKKIQVGILVLTEKRDTETKNLVDGFGKMFSVDVSCLVTHAPEFFNRGLGRNWVAKRLQRDIIWFADADYCFGKGCLDSLTDIELKDDWLYHPKQIQQTKHGSGPKYDIPLICYGTRPIDPSDFRTKIIKRAIGGIQIVTGNTARSRGYHTYDYRVRKEATEWVRGRHEDVRYRRQFHKLGQIQSIDIPNLFRIHRDR
ncbi:hypothetical protein LCGC14_0249600 [marine sediment metagenome]|uniref:Glycosyltransferase 2-like domain-containing protein n=1 Tax=marine sediment metagenome TaxID=412755 RepID=A0A0F9ULR6_9ZZZZ